jgi:predicted nucleic acid-binding protein
MRYRIFLDTNILISGIFFEGNETNLLDMTEIDLITCEEKNFVNVKTTKEFFAEIKSLK